MKLKGRVTSEDDLLNLDKLHEALEVKALVAIHDLMNAMANSTE
jgi:hypothetical protein